MPDLSQLSVGFANGSVILIRGDLIHDRGSRQTTVFESEEPVTGLEIRPSPSPTLFISTTNRILSLAIGGRIQTQAVRTLENLGCAVDCMALNQETGDVMVAREDAIYTYRSHGRGPTLGFDSPKTSITTFGDYVALVCPPKSKKDSFRRFGSTQVEDMFNTSTFIILDPDMRFVAHTESIMSKSQCLFVEWGDLFIVTIDGEVCEAFPSSVCQLII